MSHENLSVPTHTEITPDQTFEAIYREYSREITTYIASRLYRTDRHLAEDLTTETFIGLWTNLTNGTTVEHPRAFLRTVADRAIGSHFRRRSSHETATDFTTLPPAAAPSSDTPHLALLLTELEQAEERLTEACIAYKTLTHRYVTACGAHARATRPATVAQATLRRDRAELLRQAALNDFAEAALTVARARAAWNQCAVYMHDAPDAEPLPRRDPGETIRRNPLPAPRALAVGGAR